MQKKSFVLRVCDFITKYSIYALIFLVPVFFLPWTTDVLNFNKQALLLLLVFISFFALMLKTLISGKFELNISKTHIVVGVLFVVYLFATLFSVDKYGSFWGQSQIGSESLLFLIGLVVFYFLVSNIFSKKDIFRAAIVLSFSAVVAELIGIFQLFGLFILPFGFTKSVAFNTVGSTGSLALFAVILLPLAMVLLITAKKWWKVLFILEIIFSALILFLVNYPIIWWIVLASSAIFLIMGIMRRDIFDGRWMALPMFFLAISLFFVFLDLQINWLPQKPTEIFLSQKAGLDIAIQTIKEKPILGSGLGTFAYDFSKFKNPNFSNSPLWNVTFNMSSSKVLTSLATTGVLGFLALLAFMVFPVFYGIKFLFSTRQKKIASGDTEQPKQIYNILLLGLFVAVMGQGFAHFLYNSNIVLDFVYFFIIAALIGLISKDRKEYILKPSSLLTLIITFVFTLVFIFGMGFLILDGQRYVAEVIYYRGLSDYQSDQKENGLKNLESAVTLNPGSDVYFRQLSQAYLLSLQDKLQNAEATPSDEEKTKIQTLVSNAINAAKIATDINPQNVNNWSSRGYIYQSLLDVSSDASTWAITSYDSALKLDPNNPYLFAQKGNVYLAGALNLTSDKADQKKQLLGQAQTQLEKAIALYSDYSNALYSLGLVYDALGQKDKAIEKFTEVQQLNPKDTNISKILDSLKAGKSITQSATPPAENPPSANSLDNSVENPATNTGQPAPKDENKN